jgi:hypothetical protein
VTSIGDVFEVKEISKEGMFAKHNGIYSWVTREECFGCGLLEEVTSQINSNAVMFAVRMTSKTEKDGSRDHVYIFSNPDERDH